MYVLLEILVNFLFCKGAYVGWDLAHAVGNCELKLHEWNVDFAVWCTYKYLNGGAGSIGGMFLHDKHFANISKFKKLDGWWSHNYATRFKMSNEMEYAPGALAYGLSNVSMLLTSCLKASLDVSIQNFIYNCWAFYNVFFIKRFLKRLEWLL